MLLYRVLFGVAMVAALCCYLMSLITGNLKWRRRCVAIITWTMLGAAGFFALLYLGSLGYTPR